jgi:hypothetical protein
MNKRSLNIFGGGDLGLGKHPIHEAFLLFHVDYPHPLRTCIPYCSFSMNFITFINK